MFQHSLRLAIRNLSRNKIFSLINIAGLAIGMASFILISLLIENQMSIDQYHLNKDRLYVVYNKVPDNADTAVFPGTSSLVAPALKLNFPQAEEVVRVHYVANFIFSVGNKHLESTGILTDNGFFNAFTFPFLSGDPNTALTHPRDIVLSETFSKKLFGQQDPMGQVVRIDSSALFTVTGIAQDAPNNSQFIFDYILPYSYRNEVHWDILKWDDYSVNTFVLLKPGASLSTFNKQIKHLISQNATALKNELFLYPFSRFYLYGRFEHGKESGGTIDFVKKFGLIGLIILIIACINYVNLSAAGSVLRAKEVGIKKVVGAPRKTLVLQFIAESIFLTAIAGLTGLGIAQFSLPLFTELVSVRIVIPYLDVFFWIQFLVFIVLTGTIAGLYPAFILSGFQPIKVLKGFIQTSASALSFRKVLVVFQFGIAIVFIICTVVVYLQIRLGQQQNPGYDMNNLVYVFLRGDLSKQFDPASTELYRSGAITSVTRTNSPITMFWSSSDTYEWTGKNPNINININEYHSDNDFAKTMGVKVIRGRDINSKLFPTDSTAVLLNEAAVKVMGLNNPVGQVIHNKDGDWHVVGVVENFIAVNPYAPPDPLVIQGPKNWFGTLTFRLNATIPPHTALARIETILKKYNPDYPVNFIFVDEDYQQKFTGNKSLGKLALLFSILSIIITCLGLYALALYTTNARVKEIGIRKVLGASVAQITYLLSANFVLLVIISFVIAAPVAWWLMQAWLQDFTHRISFSWWIFAFTGVTGILLTLVTISFHTIRAAVSNPMQNLRTE